MESPGIILGKRHIRFPKATKTDMPPHPSISRWMKPAWILPTVEDFVNLIIDRGVRVLCTVGAKTAEKNFTFLHLHAGRKGEIIMLRYKARRG